MNEKDRIDLRKLKPIIYDEEQVQYLAVGEKVADAFRTGMELSGIYIGNLSLRRSDQRNGPFKGFCVCPHS